MYYLIYIIVTLSGVGPRAGYPIVTQEIRIPAKTDSVQVIYVQPQPPRVYQRWAIKWDMF